MILRFVYLLLGQLQRSRMYYNYGGLYENEDAIFDDDAIHIIQKYMKCSEDVADKLRRGFQKVKQRC